MDITSTLLLSLAMLQCSMVVKLILFSEDNFCAHNEAFFLQYVRRTRSSFPMHTELLRKNHEI